MKKILLINIIIFAVLLFFIEIFIWTSENIYLDKNNKNIEKKFIPFHKGIKFFNFDLENFPAKEREPEGLNYKKKPIVIFGCSYAYGFELNREDTLSYKLSNLTKRPVYNRANPGWGVQHMLYQVRKNKFYELVPEPEYAIFVLMDDHFRRLYTLTFMNREMLYENFNLRYKEKDNQLIEIRNINPVFNFIKRLYLTNKLYNFYLTNIFLRNERYQRSFDFIVKHFSESKFEMQRHWKKTKYVIVFYDEFYYDEILMNKLKDEGFIIINLPKESKLNLLSKEYTIVDYHPSAKAWEVLTPIIIKDLNL